MDIRYIYLPFELAKTLTSKSHHDVSCTQFYYHRMVTVAYTLRDGEVAFACSFQSIRDAKFSKPTGRNRSRGRLEQYLSAGRSAYANSMPFEGKFSIRTFTRHVVRMIEAPIKNGISVPGSWTNKDCMFYIGTTPMSDFNYEYLGLTPIEDL